MIVVRVDAMIVSGRKKKFDGLRADLNTSFPTKNLGERTWYTACEYELDGKKDTSETLQITFTNDMLSRLAFVS